MRTLELGHVTIHIYSRAEGDDHDGHTAVHHAVIPGTVETPALTETHD